jgi:hypothetical protein
MHTFTNEFGHPDKIVLPKELYHGWNPKQSWKLIPNKGTQQQDVSYHPGSQYHKSYIFSHDKGHWSMSQSPEADHGNPFEI